MSNVHYNAGNSPLEITITRMTATTLCIAMLPRELRFQSERSKMLCFLFILYRGCIQIFPANQGIYVASVLLFADAGQEQEVREALEVCHQPR